MTDRRSLVRRSGASGALVLAAAILAAAPSAVSDAAAPGTWGAGNYPYVDGLICSSSAVGTITTPLVAWDLGSAGSPGFLVAPVKSSGIVDSAAPPLPTVGAQSVRSVVAGEPGFPTSADIATYASLISRYGSGGGAAQTAEVASAVLAGATGTGGSCADPGAQAALLHSAADLAGPYRLRVTSAAPPARPGVPRPITATVRSAAGNPVPNVEVRFAAPDGSLSATTATTGAAGRAMVDLTAPPGTTQPTITASASIALPIGLDEVTASGTPTSTDPTGAVVPAVRVANPVEVSATARLHVNLSAAPVVDVEASPSALVVGASATPQVHLTGMYGHRGTVHVQVAGPAPLSGRALCRNVAMRAFAGAPTISYTLATTGDVSVAAGRWVPNAPGCYRVTAAVSTVDAVPQASARAAGSRLITVLDTTARVAPHTRLVAAGAPVAGAVHLTHSYGGQGTVHLRLVGPVQPRVGANACAGVDFANAPSGPSIADRLAADVRGASRYSVPTSGIGCYRLDGTARLRLPDGSGVRIPIRPAADDAVLAISPRITYSMTKISAYRDGTVSARATAIGTYDAPAHVSLRLARLPDAPLGCRSVGSGDVASGPATTGPAVRVSADLQTVSVSSARLAATGCYAPVAVLTMDANPSIRATSPVVPSQAAVEVGIDPRSLRPEDLVQARTVAGPASAAWLSGVGYLFLLVCAIVVAGAAAWRSRRE